MTDQAWEGCSEVWVGREREKGKANGTWEGPQPGGRAGHTGPGARKHRWGPAHTQPGGLMRAEGTSPQPSRAAQGMG